jgi:hypothetical protein
MIKGIFYWHVHHDRLVEELAQPIEKRIEYIRKHKPKHEVKTRLRLLKPAIGIRQAWAEYETTIEQAWAEYMRIRESAWTEYVRIREKLHKEQCNCSEWNGKELVFK